MGRPKGSSPKLTPEIILEICNQLELAVPEKYAAESVGIHEDTFHAWMRRGSEGVKTYAAFHQAVTRARAKAVSNMHVRALGGGKGSSAALWLLERRYHQEYGLRQRIDHTLADRSQNMSDGELREEIQKHESILAAFDRIKKGADPIEDL